MFSWLIATSMQLRGLIIGLAAAVVIFGALSIREMPLDVFPEFSAPVVEIQTEALGLSAEEVESLVTLNIEELLSGVPWVTSMRSESIMGLSSIKLTFERGTDLMKARQMISERLTLAYALPNISQPPNVLQPISTTNRFMMVGVSSDTIEETQLSILAKWVIEPRLLSVKGVSKVAVWGLRPRELQVRIDPDRLRDAKLVQTDIFEAAGNSLWVTPLSFLRGSSPGTGGFIDNHNQRLGVHHKMPIFTPEDMAKVAVAPQHLLMTGKKMTLGDVANVTYGHAPLIGDALLNNGKGLMFVIDKLPSANTVEVTKAIDSALADLKLGLPGVEINSSIFRLSSYIDESMANLAKATIIGSILMAVVLGLLLFSWRATVISLITIPVAVVVAVSIMHLAGATLNTMLIAGLFVALGIVIGDAILDVDRIMKQASEDATEGLQTTSANVIYHAVLKTKNITIFAVLAVALAVTPMFFLGGAVGAFLKPLASVYLLAILASFLVGIILTPALGVFLLKRSGSSATTSPLLSVSQAGYHKLLQGALRTPFVPVAVGAGAIIIGLALWPLAGHSLLPSFKEQNVIVDWSTAPGTSLKETSRIVSRVSDELRALPGVAEVNAHVGRAMRGDQIVGVNDSQIWVKIAATANYDKTIGSIQEVIKGYPGVDTGVHMFLRNTIGKVITGEDAPLVVRIFGQDRDVLREQAERVQQTLKGIDDIEQVRIVGQKTEPQVSVRVNLDAAAAANVKPGDIRRAASTIFSGINVGFLFEDQKLFDVTVWGSSDIRNSISDLEDVLIEKSDRHYVRLGDVASVSVDSTPVVINHESISPYIDVAAGIAGTNLKGVSAKVQQALREMEFPLEYHPKVLGEFAERQGVEQRVTSLVLAALIGIFLLMQACFHSWRLAAIGFTVIPAAAAGGMAAVMIVGGGAVTLGSIVGLLALIGIAARYSILLISGYQQSQLAGSAMENTVAITSDTFASIFKTSTVMIAALLPLALLGKIAGLEIIQPSALVIIGGVVTSSLYVLLSVPACYLIFASDVEKESELNLEFIDQALKEDFRLVMEREQLQKEARLNAAHT